MFRFDLLNQNVGVCIDNACPRNQTLYYKQVVKVEEVLEEEYVGDEAGEVGVVVEYVQVGVDEVPLGVEKKRYRM